LVYNDLSPLSPQLHALDGVDGSADADFGYDKDGQKPQMMTLQEM
jgi:hypothetical protein